LVFSKLDPSIPLFCIPGNHDIGDRPTNEAIDNFKMDFGDDYYSLWVGGVKFIAPNTQYLKDPSKVGTGGLNKVGFLERGCNLGKKGTHDGDAAPASEARTQTPPGPPPEKFENSVL
jgi:hypothetical protein